MFNDTQRLLSATTDDADEIDAIAVGTQVDRLCSFSESAFKDHIAKHIANC